MVCSIASAAPRRANRRRRARSLRQTRCAGSIGCSICGRRIAPSVPKAELHIYAGAGVYGALATKHAAAMAKVLARAEALGRCGVRRFVPVGREALKTALEGARVML